MFPGFYCIRFSGLLAGVMLGLFGLFSYAGAQITAGYYNGQVQQTGLAPAFQVQAATQEANAILQRLVSDNGLSAENAVRVKLVASEAINAYTDGQTIFVYQPLWVGLKSPSQRAFIIGHELSHIVLNHVSQTQMRRVGEGLVNQYVLSRFLPSNGLGSIAGRVGLSLLDSRFSRTDEYQADDLGIQLMQHAGYDPEAAIPVFHFLIKNNGRGLPQFLSDHPLNEARIQNLVQKYKLRDNG